MSMSSKNTGKNVIPPCPAAASKPSEITTHNYIKHKSRLQKTLRQMLVSSSCKRTPVGRGNSSTRHDQAASGPSCFVDWWSTPAPHWFSFPPSHSGVTAGCPRYPAACRAAMGWVFPQAAAVLCAPPAPLSPRCPLIPTSPMVSCQGASHSWDKGRTVGKAYISIPTTKEWYYHHCWHTAVVGLAFIYPCFCVFYPSVFFKVSCILIPALHLWSAEVTVIMKHDGTICLLMSS